MVRGSSFTAPCLPTSNLWERTGSGAGGSGAGGWGAGSATGALLARAGDAGVGARLGPLDRGPLVLAPVPVRRDRASSGRALPSLAASASFVRRETPDRPSLREASSS